MSVLVVTGLVGSQRIFKDVCPSWQEVKEQIGSGVFGLLVVDAPVLPTASGELFRRFEAGGAEVLQMEEFHVALRFDSQSYDHFVS